MWYNLTMTKFFFLSKKKGKGIKVIIRLRKEVCLPFCFLFVKIKPSMAIHMHVFFRRFWNSFIRWNQVFFSFFDFSFLFCSLYLILVVWRIRIEKEKNKQAKKNPKNWSYNGVVLHRNLYCWLIWKKNCTSTDDNDHTYIQTVCFTRWMDGWMDGNHNLSIFNAIFFSIYFVIVIYEFTKYIHRETERKNGSIIPYIVYIREYWCYFCSCFVVCSI